MTHAGGTCASALAAASFCAPTVRRAGRLRAPGRAPRRSLRCASMRALTPRLPRPFIPGLLLAVALVLGSAATGCGKGGARRAGAEAPALSAPSQSPTPPGAVAIATKNTTRLGGADAPSD